ncbi:MAG TPA: hypothetical protein PKL61_12425 [Accumulibacter sp.]|uniref:hypothetical protein n=1 Tax=Accumulibacter sp. TaxID=2053492 RepID=UPI002C21B7BE|nr:hypothetical protein [Accumulibacter sp.]HNI52490.1 hypothetical protein [Accumulibacter sp.]HNL97957.1 hypothetical protein [Accumulibacter sp.]
MKKFIGCLLLCLLTAAWGGTKEEENAEAQREAEELVARIKAMLAEKERRAKTLPYPDATQDIDLRQGPEWISGWRQEEQSRFAGYLSGSEIDTLLVPCQVQANGIDTANRSLMTASLAQALSGSLRVADPYLVARALGDGERRLDPQNVLRLATQLGAKRIVWCWVGHKNDDRLHLYFQVQAREGQSAFKEARNLPGTVIDHLEFSNDLPPISVFRQHLPKIVEALGFRYATPPTASPGPLATALPVGIAALVETSPGAASDALYLQLLGSLVPADASRLRERLYERSLLIAWQLPADQPTTRRLLARAYQGVHMRPAALIALRPGQAGAGSAAPTMAMDLPDAEERALIASLNGDLPAIEQALSEIPISAQRIMAEIEATDIRFAYYRDRVRHAQARQALLDALPADWRPFVARRFADADPVKLRRFDNYATLRALGQIFPAAGAGIEQQQLGWQVTGHSESSDLDVALGAYFSPALAGVERRHCCDSAQWRLDRLDVLDFLVQSGVANIVYKARRMAVAQALPRETLDYVNALDAVFGTHPAIMRVRAIAENDLAKRAAGYVRQSMLNKAERSAELARHWEDNTAHTPSDRPSHVTRWHYVADPHGRRKPDPLGLDIARAALANARFDNGPLVAAFHLTKDFAEREQLLQAMAGRFVGDSTVVLLKADLLLAQGNRRAAMEILAAELQSKPEPDDLYVRLGDLLIGERRYREAADVFASLPGLTDGSANSLVIGNYAYRAGSRFYQCGETDLAIPFFRIAAAQSNGSQAEMISRARLALLDEAYLPALAALFESVQRYSQPRDIAEYLSLLHLTGQSAAADNGFHSLATRIGAPEVWRAALVSSQRRGFDERRLIEWSEQFGRSQGPQVHRLAAEFLAMAVVTDRTPSAEAGPAIDRLLHMSNTHRSDLRVFVEGLAALKGKDFAAARKALSQTGETRAGEGASPARTVLAYYAIAAMKSGQHAAVEQVVAAIPAEEHDLDYWLAKSVIAALSGKADAVANFRQAVNHLNEKHLRLLGAEYQLADVAQMLHDLTGDNEFRKLALEVARFNQKIHPWEAWSFAWEAALTEDRAHRVTALDKAVYLDRQSQMLLRLPPQEVEAAARRSGKTPPFRLDKKPGRAV